MLYNKICIAFVCMMLAMPQITFSQKLAVPVISSGLSYRQDPITVVDTEPVGNKYRFYYEAVEPAVYFSLDIKEKVFKSKRFSLELSNYFTYSKFREITPDNTNPYYTIKQKRFKHDHFLSVLYSFKSKINKPHFLIGAGIGYMNFGTGFRYDHYQINYDQSGNMVDFQKENRKTSFSFLAPKLIIGLEKNRYNAFIILNGTPDIYNEPNPTLWIEAKLTYTFKFFNKK